MSSGTELRLYLRGYYDTSALGLEVRKKDGVPKYYWIAASPDVNFGTLKLRVELSRDKQMLWINGTSRFVASIEAAYDDVSDSFYTRLGMARKASVTPDMELMQFDAARFPERTASRDVVFDGFVRE